MDRLDVAAGKSFGTEHNKLKQRVERLERIVLRMLELVTVEERDQIMKEQEQ
jgi:hypothetical protein